MKKSAADYLPAFIRLKTKLDRAQSPICQRVLKNRLLKLFKKVYKLAAFEQEFFNALNDYTARSFEE